MVSMFPVHSKAKPLAGAKRWKLGFEKGNLAGLPQPRDDDDRNSSLEKRCADCGRWNAPHEDRCERCGRPLAGSRGTFIRRETEEAESLPLPPSHALPAKPAEEPEWREELSRKIAGYRERSEAQGQKELFDDEEETAELTPPRAAKRAPVGKAKLPPIREARSNDLPLPSRSAAGERSILPPPPASRDWKSEVRRVKPAAPVRPPIVDRSASPAQPAAPVEPRSNPRGRAAPISLRLVAGLMDVAVVAAALGVFAAVCMSVSESILGGEDGIRLIAMAFVLLMAFYWIFYLRFLGRTAGMTWLGLRVLNFDGNLPDESQRRARAFGTVLSAAALGIGFAWAAADEGRLTWHDRISKTFVAMDR
jgi:uncharacterized RDD family membrane protein YckC